MSARRAHVLTEAGARLVDALEAARDDTAREATEAMRAEIPAYGRVTAPRFFEDVREHVATHVDLLARSLRGGRLPDEEELIFERGPATRRVQRGIGLGDLQHAYRIAHRHMWRALVSAATDEETRTAALTLVDPVSQYINVVSTRIAELYVEAERLLVAEAERARRDLLEDLLAGRAVPLGPRTDALAAAGLTPESSFVIVTGLPADGALTDEQAMRIAAATTGRVSGRGPAPVSVVRGDEIVTVLPARPGAGAALAAAIETVRDRLAEQGPALRVGTSTIVSGLRMAPTAYREACTARALTSERQNVVCFCGMAAFDYLVLTGDDTAARLIAPEIARFVAEDLADGGVLTSTLLAYAAADLNVKAAAEQLFIHVNTAHNRLARIAERTGRDVRRLNDVIELLIATRLAGAPAQTSSAWSNQ